MRIRQEPWSVSLEERAAARLFVELPTRPDDQVTVRLSGKSRSARHCASLASGDELWELPALVRSPSGRQPELKRHQYGRQTRLEIVEPDESRTVSAPPFVIGHDRDPTTEFWELLQDHHVERIAEWTDGGGPSGSIVRAAGRTLVEWPTFEASYWRVDEGDADAPRQLIVEIAQRCADWLHDLCERPRRSLRRVRAMQPIAKAQDIDAACLRWLTRQPGRSIAERAGPRQQILAVHREDAVDTPENRVLRDFLRLSARAALRYVHLYRQHRDSERWKSVRRYVDLVRRLMTRSPIAAVPQLVGEPTRNYVLQFDARYARLWTYYDRLRRHEDVHDQLEPWRHRLWAEYCLLAVRRALDRSEAGDDAKGPRGARADRRLLGPAQLLREAVHGQFINPETAGGAWLLDESHPTAIRVVLGAALASSETPILQALARLAPDFVITVSPAFRHNYPARVLGVWTLFSPNESSNSLKGRLDRLGLALREAGAMDCCGLLLVPASTTSPFEGEVLHGGVAAIRQKLPHPSSSVEDAHFAALLARLLGIRR